MEKNVKITVVGIGGVGGYISGMLAKTYENVTLVARGARKKSLEKEGICLHSQYNGEITAKAKRVVESGREIEEIQDFIFLCVKNYSLEEVCRDLQNCIDYEWSRYGRTDEKLFEKRNSRRISYLYYRLF